MILVDTNILIDVITCDPVWFEWSRSQLESAAISDDEVVINDIVYAELSIGYARMEQLDAMISSAGARMKRHGWLTAYERTSRSV